MTPEGRGVGLFAIIVLLVALPLAGWAIAEEQWRLLAVIVVGILTPLVSTWSFAIMIGAYALMVPFEALLAISGDGGASSLMRYVGIGAGGVLAAAALLRGRVVWPPPAFWWWLLFLLWSGATALWAADPSLAAARLKTATSVFLLYAVAVCVRVAKREAIAAAMAATVGGVGAAAYALYAYAQGVTFAGERASLMAGDQAADPNYFAAALLLPLAFALTGVWASKTRVLQLAAMGGVMIIAGGIYTTMSRGALLALAVLALILLYRLRLRWQVLAPIGCLLALICVMPDVFFERILATGEDAGAGRLDIWRVGVVALREYGLFGAGIGNFPAAYDEWVSFAGVEGAARSSPLAHNTYLSTCVEMGIVGLFLLLGACASHLRTVRGAVVERVGQDNTYLFAVEAACFAGLTAGIFIEVAWSKMFWFQWILLTACVSAYQGNEGGEDPGRVAIDDSGEQPFAADGRGSYHDHRRERLHGGELA